MDNTTIDKIHLCLNEISICKQLLDSQKVDDLCGRLLSIYIMIRADDITKMWSHSLPKGEIDRILSDEIKNKYNCKFRHIRDKYGAHYQTVAEDKTIDIFENSRIFRSFDYGSISEFIDELFLAENLIEEIETEYIGFEFLDDFNMALEAIDTLYADDKAMYSINTYKTDIHDLYFITKEEFGLDDGYGVTNELRFTSNITPENE